jgi:hypothetical protein
MKNVLIGHQIKKQSSHATTETNIVNLRYKLFEIFANTNQPLGTQIN